MADENDVAGQCRLAEPGRGGSGAGADSAPARHRALSAGGAAAGRGPRVVGAAASRMRCAAAALIGVFTQRDADDRGAAGGRPAPGRHAGDHPQGAQAAGRHRAPGGAGAASHPHRRDGADPAVPRARVEEVPEISPPAGRPRDRGARAQRDDAVPPDRGALPAAARRARRRGRAERDPARPARRRSSRPRCPSLSTAGEAGAARDGRRQGAARAARGRPDQGSGGAGARLQDPVAGRVRGGQEPARVLPARAAQGHPEGARPDRRARPGARRAARRRSRPPG